MICSSIGTTQDRLLISDMHAATSRRCTCNERHFPHCDHCTAGNKVVTASDLTYTTKLHLRIAKAYRACAALPPTLGYWSRNLGQILVPWGGSPEMHNMMHKPP